MEEEEVDATKSTKSITSTGPKSSLRTSTADTAVPRESHVEFSLPAQAEKEAEAEDGPRPESAQPDVPPSASRRSIKSPAEGRVSTSASIQTIRRPDTTEDGGGEYDEEGVDEEEDVDEDEEDDEEEDDEEEEDEDEEQEDEETDEETRLQRAAEEEALYLEKMKLIERYINAKADYKYLMKKNSYLQDKLYKICVRKGFIVESAGVEAEDKGKTKKKRKLSIVTTIKNVEEEQLEELGIDEDDTDAVAEHLAEQGSTEQGPAGGGFKNFLQAAMESKYHKVIRQIWDSEQSKTKDRVAHEMNIGKIQENREKWEKIHQTKFLDLMERVKLASDAAIDSNTGRHLQNWETDQFMEEMAKIHAKLCQTMVKMYQNRHGLEFALKRLEETEVQGEGLQMLEYEQLQAENYSLKEKLDDRQRDVENIKAKIAHAVQILAHFRECMSKLQEKMDDGNAKLAIINRRVYQVREITDVVTQRYEVYKEEERNLIAESGLLDNTKLLRDFEKTHYDVTDLREEKRKLQKKMLGKSREIEELQAKIRDIQLNLTELQRLANERASKADEAISAVKTADDQGEGEVVVDSKELKQQKLFRLHWLLETRNLDPAIMAPPPPIVKLPPILRDYHCHFLK